MVVVFYLGSAATTVWLVVVRWVCVVADESGQEVQLLFERVVHTRLHSRHHLELALQQSQSCAHRGVGRHVGNLHVRSSCKAATFFNDGAQQLEQHHRRLFIWQGQDVVPQCAGADVYVTELTGGNRSVIPLNPKSARLEAPG